MTNDYNENFQYDSCVSRGICSISPRNSALQTIVVLYLRLFAKYLIKFDSNDINVNTKNLILKTITSAIFNYEFNDTTFLLILQQIRIELPKIIDDFSEKFPDEDLEVERKKVFEIFEETSNINSAIRYGELIFNRAQEKIKTDIRNLYSIMLVISKSISINLLELKSFNENYDTGFSTILELLNKINLEENNIEILKSIIIKGAKFNIEILKQLREEQEKRYGEMQEAEVSYSTYPNKAILVVGSNIKELEDILEALKNVDVDIYTHDEMIIAHVFPYFNRYKHLKGQFGQGLENCLLDFATFPGPIILTKNSLHNVENLYRGQLFTTDDIYLKGVIKIRENDYSKLIETIENSRGFKTGKNCETINLGYSFNETLEKIVDKINTKNFNKIVILGPCLYSLEQTTYFEKLIKTLPKDILIISFSYKLERENLIHINTCFESYSLIKIYNYIKNFNLPTSVFFPKCDKDTISYMIDLVRNKNTKVFVGKCIPIILNPTLLNTMKNIFEINSISSVKKDLEYIL